MRGALQAWTQKALRLLELPEAIVERVERGDLSFTAADFVRRGIDRGDVTAERAKDLVDQHVDGSSQRAGAQARRRLRPAAARELRGDLRAPRRGRPRRERAPRDERDPDGQPIPVPSSSSAPSRVSDADVDGFILGAFLYHSASDRTRKVLRITGEADAHERAVAGPG